MINSFITAKRNLKVHNPQFLFSNIREPLIEVTKNWLYVLNKLFKNLNNLKWKYYLKLFSKLRRIFFRLGTGSYDH